jgi:putative hemolysin
MIEGVMRLADQSVGVVWLEVGATREEIIRTLTKEGRYSRLLACRGSVDERVGVVHTKDLERALVLRVLDLFKRRGLHMAVVVVEFGTTEGVVTPTDILESIAGELPEHGDELELKIVRREDGSWLVDGLVPIDEFEDRTGVRDLRGAASFTPSQASFSTILGTCRQSANALLSAT